MSSADNPERTSSAAFEARAEVGHVYQGILAKLLDAKVELLDELDNKQPGLVDPIASHLDHLGKAALVHGEIKALNELSLLFREADAGFAVNNSLQNSPDTL